MISPEALRQRTTGNPLLLVMVVNELVRQGILQEGRATGRGRGVWRQRYQGAQRACATYLCIASGAATGEGLKGQLPFTLRALMTRNALQGGVPMNHYTAVMKQKGDWWVG